MIALVAAATVALAPGAVLSRYAAAVAGLREASVFTLEYTLEQTGARTLEQRHRIFRSGGNERDEILAVNGTRTTSPSVRIFRGRRYRYTVAALAPRANAYAFTYVGTRRDGKHSDYVFDVAPRAPSANFAFTRVAIDGVTFLPQSVAFRSGAHGGSGTVAFVKAAGHWVVASANATADANGGAAHERLTFSGWRFPDALPASTFQAARPLPTLPPS